LWKTDPLVVTKDSERAVTGPRKAPRGWLPGVLEGLSIAISSLRVNHQPLSETGHDLQPAMEAVCGKPSSAVPACPVRKPCPCSTWSPVSKTPSPYPADLEK